MLATKITELDPVNDAHSVNNSMRPLLSYGVKGSKTGRRTYLYVEFLRRFNKEVKLLDLASVYKRARPLFGGRMRQSFALLGENGPNLCVCEGIEEAFMYLTVKLYKLFACIIVLI